MDILNFMPGFMKKMAAPQYFVELKTNAEKLQKEVDEIMGTDLTSITLDKEKMANMTEMEILEFAFEQFKKSKAVGNMNKENLEKSRLITTYVGALAELAWARFRYENMDNAFGKAEHLYYDEKNKIIEIK